MSIIITAGACAATLSTAILGSIQIFRRTQWKEALDLTPTLTYTVIAAILWIGAISL